MIKGSYDSNPKLCRLTYLLTRVKSRDASASKNYGIILKNFMNAYLMFLYNWRMKIDLHEQFI